MYVCMYACMYMIFMCLGTPVQDEHMVDEHMVLQAFQQEVCHTYVRM